MTISRDKTETDHTIFQVNSKSELQKISKAIENTIIKIDWKRHQCILYLMHVSKIILRPSHLTKQKLTKLYFKAILKVYNSRFQKHWKCNYKNSIEKDMNVLTFIFDACSPNVSSYTVSQTVYAQTTTKPEGNLIFG